MRTTRAIVAWYILCSSITTWAAETTWLKVAESATGQRTGSVMLYAPDLKRMILLGPAKDAAFVQSFDPTTRSWADVTTVAPPLKQFNPYYQAAYDPATKSIFCLTGGNMLYCLSLAENKWNSLAPSPELEGLSWHTMACDPQARDWSSSARIRRPGMSAGAARWFMTSTRENGAGSMSAMRRPPGSTRSWSR